MELLEEGQHRRIRPVQVFEDENGRTLGREVLEEPPPGSELLGALHVDARANAEREQALAEPPSLVRARQDPVELRGRNADRVRLEDALRGP